MGEGTGDGVESVALPAPSLCRRGQTCAEEQRDGDHRQGWAGIPSAGRGGDSFPQKRRQKTPLYGRALLRRGL